MDKPIVAAFDFDGTLTKRDTFIPFALFAAGPWKWMKNLILLTPSVLLFIFRVITRQQLKEKAIALFFKGMPYRELKPLAEEFAKELIPSLLKPKAVEALKWHQKEGHRVIIISASIETYLRPWAKIMHIDDVIGSRLELDSNGTITGRLEGNNCRAAEKVTRLKELLGPEKDYELYAYGDSRGDKELLAYADHRFFRKV